MSVMVSIAVSQVGMTELIFANPGVKVKGQYYCNVLRSQHMLPEIKRVAKRCLFTKQYVAYGEIGHFLCSVISQGKVVVLCFNTEKCKVMKLGAVDNGQYFLHDNNKQTELLCCENEKDLGVWIIKI